MNRLWSDIWKTLRGPVSLKGFLALSAAILLYYFIIRVSSVTSSPRDAQFLYGSTAQLLMPIAGAMGTFAVVSARPLGLRDLLRQSTRTRFVCDMQTLAHGYVALTLQTLLFAFALTVINVVQVGEPQIGVAQLLYPPAFSLLGISVGYLVGVAIDVLLRLPLAGAYVFSLLVGLIIFILAISLPSSLSAKDAERYSFVITSRALEPSAQVSTDLLFAHEAVAASAALFMFATVGALLLVNSRSRIVSLTSAGLAIVVLALGIQGVGAVSAPIVERPQAGNFACIGDRYTVCVFTNEKTGAARLQRAQARIGRQLPPSMVPRMIVQRGLQVEGRQAGPTAYFLETPSSDEKAVVYVAEFVFKASGCSAEQVFTDSRLRSLYDYVVQQGSSPGPADQSTDQMIASARRAMQNCAEN